MASKGSFYTNNATVYTDTNPAGPADAPLPAAIGEARSSFYASGQQYAGIDLQAWYLSFSVAGGVLLSNEWLFGYLFDMPVTFPANMAGSVAKAGNSASLTTALSLRKNGIEFATLTFNGVTGTFASPAATSFIVGDLLEVYAPNTADPTLAHISATLFATRN